MALTGKQEEAALLLAEDRLLDADIAAQVGLSARGLYRWKSLPEFSQRVKALREEVRTGIRQRGIAMLENRVRRLDKTWRDLQQVILERSEDVETLTEPGGRTGLVAVVTVTKHGDKVYGVDTSLLKEIRDLEKQAAIELGQWMEKQEINGGKPLLITTIRANVPAVASADADS